MALLLTAATVGGFLLDHHVSLTSQAMVYVLAVVFASYRLRWPCVNQTVLWIWHPGWPPPWTTACNAACVKPRCWAPGRGAGQA